MSGPTGAALHELLERHGEASYESEAVIPHAVSVAISFVRAMPFDLAAPEVDVAPDGCVVLGWTFAQRVRLGISIGRSGRLALSWLHGSDSGHAVHEFDGEFIPNEILNAIRRLSLPGLE